MANHSSILAWRIPIDKEAWWATVHGVANGWTWLKWFSMHADSVLKPELNFLIGLSHHEVITWPPKDHPQRPPCPVSPPDDFGLCLHAVPTAAPGLASPRPFHNLSVFVFVCPPLGVDEGRHTPRCLMMFIQHIAQCSATPGAHRVSV